MAGIPTGNNIPSGGNVLSSTGNVVSGNNIPSTSTALAPPGTPSLWFSAQNIDGLSNTSLVDGQTLATWVNLGSLGASGNVLQAVAGMKPAFKLVASAGKLGNKSCVRSDGARWMQSGALTTLTQPNLVAAVAMTTSVAAGFRWITDGRTSERNIVGQNGTPVEAFANSFVQPVNGWAANSYQSVNVNFNGAVSIGRLDGVAGSAVNPGTGGLDGITLFSDLAGGSLWTGDIVEVLIYTGGGQPTAAQVEAYFVSAYGATPQ
jgi:hypothetical protein